jgi:hypothetical protein
MDGTATARTIVPSRILTLTGYINASGTVSYARKPADGKNKISEIFAEYRADTWQHNVSRRGIL